MPPSALARLRARCLALPESYEKEAWGEPTFRVTKGKIFAMFASAATHHGKPAKGATVATSAAGQQRERGRNAVWLLATPENQRFMMEHDARRFFRPPYVGAYGWVGVYLDGVCDWTELPQLIEDAWRLAAPKSLLKRIASESAERP